MTSQPLTPAGAAVEDLLPFYAAGVLDAGEMAEVKAALAADPELRRRLALVEEERTETILLNEGIRGPSTRALDRLMAAIEAEPARVPRLSLAERLAAFLHGVTPRQVVWASAAAALLLMLNGAALIGLATRSPEGGFQTASHGQTPVMAGSQFTVIFQPGATAAEIGALLERNGARLVDGPRAGGVFRIAVGERVLTTAERDALVARLRAETGVIRLVAPALP
jgi:anti-sigma factor RsiW